MLWTTYVLLECIFSISVLDLVPFSLVAVPCSPLGSAWCHTLSVDMEIVCGEESHRLCSGGPLRKAETCLGVEKTLM